jgi:hypothetical protein
MSNNATLFLIAAVVGAALGTVAFFGMSPFIHEITQQINTGTTSGTGALQHAATFAFNPTTAAATTSSILNSDGQDRFVEAAYVGCSGVGTSGAASGAGGGLANLTLTIATTSASAPAALINTAYVLQQNMATGTPDSMVASTSISKFATGNAIRWQSGSYMSISANATNTAACVVSVLYSQGLGF